jgi:hypothetical protein
MKGLELSNVSAQSSADMPRDMQICSTVTVRYDM